MAVQGSGSLKDRVKAKAFELGFDLAGITTAQRTPHYDAYEAWLEKGMQAGMDYLAAESGRALRRSPADVLPGAHSVLVLGRRYAGRKPESGRNEQPEFGLLGRVAAYAEDEDYHATLQDGAAALLDYIKDTVGPGLAGRAYTDTGPVLEREFAQRAGLGWQGKNTCLIHPDLGSYFFLTEIFLNIEMEADAPFEADRCGTCRRCLDACPTGCLLPGRVLDASRCLAYLTIENKGGIPAELRPALGGWIFGCDICQQVCPWNRKLDPLQPELDLLELLFVSPQEFNRRFKTSPIRRAKRRGLLRSAAVVLGNLANPAAVPALEQALKTEAESLVRVHAAWALGRIGDSAARAALSSALPMAQAQGDAYLVAEIQSALEDSHVH